MENKFNIGIINDIFNQNVLTLLKTKKGKKIIKEYVNTIKSDETLLLEYKVFDYIENNSLSKEHVNGAIDILKNISRKNISESNEKLNNILINNNLIKKTDIINEDLYKNINKLIFDKKSTKYINEKVKALNSISEHIENRKNNDILTEDNEFKDFKLDDLTVNVMVKNFNERYSDVLNEDEIKIFKIVSNGTEDEQINLFEELKKECISTTNEYLKEENILVEDKEKLLNVKETLLEQKFSKENLIDDIITLIELKETLS